ncbi:hypothetical protein G3496_20380 [Shewanella baltica]|uniref:hypothetical protein n=1 Tax=Shewanella baltica TaxID=62322 RepID=UPI00217E3D10|nr:hypothetical protein [Shewanella baltica]MCS6137265.1 hypothetical protein [Shewanella baltica]
MENLIADFKSATNMDVQTQGNLAVKLACVLSFLRGHLFMSKWLLRKLSLSHIIAQSLA